MRNVSGRSANDGLRMAWETRGGAENPHEWFHLNEIHLSPHIRLSQGEKKQHWYVLPLEHVVLGLYDFVSFPFWHK